MTDIIDDHAPTSPFPHSPLSFTAADVDTISHLSGVELNDVGGGERQWRMRER